ncbi:MAG: Nif3-like dinuclear metal center hexameric protein [Proteobacteria bacterium]|nr:Nif3-like dinuclear metal center hexameric protein [Pseudomonadota bacterium]
MASLGSVVRFLNGELRVKSFRDSSRNGLQVRGRGEICKVGFAVDASIEVFEKAARAGCDLVVVHHGILWKGKRDVTHNRGRRIAFLKGRRMGLYACHLPLDAHPIYGNNIVLAEMLGLGRIERFGRYEGAYIGYMGRFSRPMPLRRLASVLGRGIGARCLALPYGKGAVRTVGIVSGRGSSLFPEAVRKGLDCFVTGEMLHEAVVEARDARVSLVIGGHYATETVGVRALMPLIGERFGVDTVFIDAPVSI